MSTRMEQREDRAGGRMDRSHKHLAGLYAGGSGPRDIAGASGVTSQELPEPLKRCNSSVEKFARNRPTRPARQGPSPAPTLRFIQNPSSGVQDALAVS